MVTGSLGRRYARAILDLATEQKNLDKVGADLRGLAGAMKQSDELVSVLTNPAIRRADRRNRVNGRKVCHIARGGCAVHAHRAPYWPMHVGQSVRNSFSDNALQRCGKSWKWSHVCITLLRNR